MTIEDKETRIVNEIHVAKTVESLVEKGYNRVSVNRVDRSRFEIEADRREGGVMKIPVSAAQEVRKSLPELKRLRDVMQVPEVKNALDHIIEAVSGK